MRKRTLICVECPNGCELEVCFDDNNQINIEDSVCKRGYKWAKQELTDPRRTIASSVAVDNGDWPLVSVKTNRAIPLTDISKVMEAIKAIRVQAPVKLGDVLIVNAAKTDVSIIATRNIILSQTSTGETSKE
jgi:CxxC motif-containing protein